MILCPNCKNNIIVKNYKNSAGSQRYKCKHCNKYFVESPKKAPISEEKKELINKMLNERTSLRGICRVLRISFSTLQRYVNNVYSNVEKKVDTIKKSPINSGMR